jgi:hypothetical protein
MSRLLQGHRPNAPSSRCVIRTTHLGGRGWINQHQCTFATPVRERVLSTKEKPTKGNKFLHQPAASAAGSGVDHQRRSTATRTIVAPQENFISIAVDLKRGLRQVIQGCRFASAALGTSGLIPPRDNNVEAHGLAGCLTLDQHGLRGVSIPRSSSFPSPFSDRNRREETVVVSSGGLDAIPPLPSISPCLTITAIVDG